MSPRPEDFIDSEFWDWYEEEGPKWLLRHRLDIINTMYEAYEDSLDDQGSVMMRPGAPFMFMGDPVELQEFVGVLKKILPEALGNPPPNKIKPITAIDINKLRQSLDTIKLKRRKTNEDNKS